MQTIIKIQNRIIPSTNTLLAALKQMDGQKVKMLFVFEEMHFVSILTIGDIQRAIVNNISLDTVISKVVQRNKQFAHIGESRDDIRSKMLDLRAECMPVLDGHGELVDVIFWRDLFEKEESDLRHKIDLPVVIMAGGKGTRLKPLTNVIPKPLVPVGDKTILEEILNQFEGIGCQKFYMSVNYKSDLMRFYLEQLDHHYDIDFFEEPRPLGTIGSVSLLKGKITTPFFVSNCDIIIDQVRCLRADRSCHFSASVLNLLFQSIPVGIVDKTSGDHKGFTDKVLRKRAFFLHQRQLFQKLLCFGSASLITKECHIAFRDHLSDPIDLTQLIKGCIEACVRILVKMFHDKLGIG